MPEKVAEKIAVIGLGRVGLPLALVLAEEDFKVYGVEINSKITTSLKEKRMPFKEEGAARLLTKHYGKNFKVGKAQGVSDCTTVILCVGTLLSDGITPDTSAVFKALDGLIVYLRNNVLIILRSTVPPHGTSYVREYLDKKFKKKYSLAYAPERIAEGFAVSELYEIPEIIGSFDEKSAAKASKVLTFAPEFIKADPLTAELAKLTLNTYRYANFAMANELMMIMNHYERDIHKVLKVANKNYKRGGIPSPGFAAGPCLVKDGFFLKHATPYNTLVTGSFTINDGLPLYLLTQLKKRMKIKGKKVAFLGLSFKKNIDDVRESLSLKFVSLLKKSGAKVVTHDPYLKKKNLKKVLNGADLVVLAVNHDDYKKITLPKLKADVGVKSLVCDIWNVLSSGKIFFEINTAK